MKIAFVVHSFPSISETFILNQITGLIDLGHDVDIISRSTPKNQLVHEDVQKYNLINRTVYLDDVPSNRIIRLLFAIALIFKFLPKNPIAVLSSLNVIKYKGDAFSLYLLYDLIPFLNKRYDIVQSHFGSNGNFVALLKKLGLKVKLVTMFHGIDIRAGIDQGGSIFKPVFEYGDCLLAISNYNYQNLVEFGAETNKISYHPVGIDLTKFLYRNKFNYSNNIKPIKILTVARLFEEKALRYGIMAIKILLNLNPSLKIEYDIVGNGPLEPELKSLVNELNLNEIVSFHGALTQEDVSKQLYLSNVFLLPSVAESLPVVLMEAQAVGLPIVATSVGGVSQIIKDGESGFLAPSKDPEALANHLDYLIRRPWKMREIGLKGRSHVELNYDINKLNKKLEKIYYELLEISLI